ncbi:hypothetical protein LAUMK35_02545 [Mycobacterium pseudokansasii]|nr:hypothetical protein LAUMK35_02545 [Mycobacterium pseudokansasii]VAZ95184.1 hypothetical protein LAUMK21_02545 [Mycobacterium pseudokansasii]
MHMSTYSPLRGRKNTCSQTTSATQTPPNGGNYGLVLPRTCCDGWYSGEPAGSTVMPPYRVCDDGFECAWRAGTSRWDRPGGTVGAVSAQSTPCMHTRCHECTLDAPAFQLPRTAAPNAGSDEFVAHVGLSDLAATARLVRSSHRPRTETGLPPRRPDVRAGNRRCRKRVGHWAIRRKRPGTSRPRAIRRRIPGLPRPG